jgi:Bacterial extracellular solute-binding proteins, family 5 Middle
LSGLRAPRIRVASVSAATSFRGEFDAQTHTAATQSASHATALRDKCRGLGARGVWSNRGATCCDLTCLRAHRCSTHGRIACRGRTDSRARSGTTDAERPAAEAGWELAPDMDRREFRRVERRKGVQFHTGRELTSDDVKWNLLRVRDPKVGVAQLATQSAWFTSIDTPDKYTLVLKTDQPRPFMFDFFEYLNILDPVSKQGPDADSTLVGTGPFVWQEYRQGEPINSERADTVNMAQVPPVVTGTSAQMRRASAAINIVSS